MPAAFIVLTLAVPSCGFDDTELKNSLSELEQRIDMLEDYSEQIRSDIESLQEIVKKLQESVTVDSVIEDENGYTIHFSDGTSITIHDGQDGMTPPSITVIQENGTYWWGLLNPDGSEEFILDGNGDKIPVTGESPKIRINENSGHWEISTDGGQTWNDTGVSATGSGSDNFFKSITEDELYVYITLHSGTTIKLPKTSGMKCIFDVSGTVWFSAGEAKEIGCTLIGHESVVITKPDGWKASWENGTLTVTAPPSENTFAEKEGRIDLSMTSSNGQSLQAGIEVAVGTGFDIDIVQDGLSATVTITPSNESTYYFSDMIRTASISSYGADYTEQVNTYVKALIDMYMSMGLPAGQILEMMCCIGVYTHNYSNLLPDTEYIVYAVPVDGECSISGDPAFMTAMSAPASDPSTIEVDFSISNLTSRSVTVNAFPTDKSTRYWWSITEEGTTADEILEQMDTDALLSTSSIGDDYYNYTGLSPYTSYVPYYFGIDEQGQIASDIRFGEPFSTPAATVSDAYVEIRYDKYYDGDDIAENFPDYANAAGKAFVRLVAYENEYAEDYLYAVLDGDLTDESAYSDEEAIQDLQSIGHNAFMSTYYMEWNKEYTITAVAIDSDGNYGKVFRSAEIFTKEGASPLNGFTPVSGMNIPLKSVKFRASAF